MSKFSPRVPRKTHPPSPAHRGEKSAAGVSRRISSSTRNRRRWIVGSGALAALLVMAGVASLTDFDWAGLQQKIAGLNSPLVLMLMATLPVAGFSVGVVYLVAGAKFGPAVGGAAVAAATAVHLLLTHWIARGFLREPLLRLLARRNHQLPAIPPGENASVAVMAALVPGLPYFARNYLLALSGMPLRTYFWICLPIYVARSYVTIFLGDLTGNPSGRRLFLLAAVYAVKLGICAYLLARLRRRYKLREGQPNPGVPAGGAGTSVSRKPSEHLLKSV